MIRPYFKWFDFWVGAFVRVSDNPFNPHVLYIQPLPMLGVSIRLWRPAMPEDR